MPLDATDRQLALQILDRGWLDGEAIRQLGALANAQGRSFLDVLRGSGRLSPEAIATLLGDLRDERKTAPLSRAQLQAALGAASTAPPSPSASPPPATGALEAGQRFGPFEIEAELGRGGMGAVFRARHTGLDKTVAVKVLIAGRDAGDEELRRFLAEARIAASLDHPHIVRILDSGQVGARTYIAMDFIEGTDLASLLAAGKVSERAGARVIEDIARAVEHAHARGIIHRDIKPQNILIDRSSTARLADFGCAKAGDDGTTQTGAVVGTLKYMAPEQAEDAKAADERADIYGLGAILYHVLTGRPPHTGVTPTNVLMSIATKTPPRPRELKPTVDPALEAVCLRAIASSPDDRYASAEELARALADARAGLRAPAASPITTRSPLPLLGALLGLITLTALAWALLSTDAPAPAPPPATLAIRDWQPAPGSWVRERSLTLRGRVSPPDATVSYGLSSVEAIDGRFELALQLPEALDGLALELRAPGGASERVVAPLRFDFSAPLISLEGWPELTTEARVTLRGRVEDAHLSRLELDGQRLDCDASGAFSRELELPLGESRFELRARDEAGNEGALSARVTREAAAEAAAADPSPPERDARGPRLNLRAPAEGAVVGRRVSFELRSDEPLSALELAGFAVGAERLEAGQLSWSGEVELPEGAAAFVVKARDRAGNEVELRRAVILDVSPPQLRSLASESAPDWSGAVAFAGAVEDQSPVTLTWLEAGQAIELEAGAFRVEGDHAAMLGGVTVLARDALGQESRLELSPPLPLLHDIAAWRAFSEDEARRQSHCEAELAFVEAAFEGDLRRVGLRRYEMQGLATWVATFATRTGELELQLIPGGRGLMGAPEGEAGSAASERPVHEVQLAPFLFGRHELLIGQYHRFSKTKKLEEKADRWLRPVDDMTFERALDFLSDWSKANGCERLRLPSEAEWEYAARAGTRTAYFCGDALRPDAYVPERVEVGEVEAKTRPNGFGIYDVIGHQEEWVADEWADDYEGAPTDGSPRGATKDKGWGVIRGGSRQRMEPAGLRSAARRRAARGDDDDERFQAVGMRLAASVVEPARRWAQRRR